MQDLDAIRQGADANAPVFGLSASQIHRRLKAAAQAAGLGDGFSGHSGRVGMATRMTRLGAPMPVVMRQGRWVSSRMPARYVRNEERQRRACLSVLSAVREQRRPTTEEAAFWQRLDCIAIIRIDLN